LHDGPQIPRQHVGLERSYGRERAHPRQEETYPQHGLSAPNALMRKALMQ
jgi:hypothetical protein